MVKLAKLLIKRPMLYFILLYVWGSLMNIVGILVSVIMLISCHKPHWFKRVWYFEVGNNWGGLSLGCCFLVAKGMSKSWTHSTKCHEYGHTYQNAILGPLWPFVVAIPSAIRYHYQNWRTKHNLPNKEYDSIWFEGSATQIGALTNERTN